MKYFSPKFPLFLSIFFLVVACNQTAKTTNKSNIDDGKIFKDITKAEAQELIKAHSEYILLDVRTPEEIAKGQIPNSTSLDFKVSNFKEQLNKLSKEDTYIVYCHSGGRSGKTLKIMENLGFNAAYNLLGGYSKWK